jgi:hypothetical protein
LRRPWPDPEEKNVTSKVVDGKLNKKGLDLTSLRPAEAVWLYIIKIAWMVWATYDFTRVARMYICIPKITIRVYFGETGNAKCWH